MVISGIFTKLKDWVAPKAYDYNYEEPRLRAPSVSSPTESAPPVEKTFLLAGLTDNMQTLLRMLYSGISSVQHDAVDHHSESLNRSPDDNESKLVINYNKLQEFIKDNESSIKEEFKKVGFEPTLNRSNYTLDTDGNYIPKLTEVQCHQFFTLNYLLDINNNHSNIDKQEALGFLLDFADRGLKVTNRVGSSQISANFRNDHFELLTIPEANSTIQEVYSEYVKPSLEQDSGMKLPILDLYEALLNGDSKEFKNIYSRLSIINTNNAGKKYYVLNKITEIDNKVKEFSTPLDIEQSFDGAEVASKIINHSHPRTAYTVAADNIFINPAQEDEVRSSRSSASTSTRQPPFTESPVQGMTSEEIKFWQTELEVKRVLASSGDPVLTSIYVLQRLLGSRAESLSDPSKAVLTMEKAYLEDQNKDLTKNGEDRVAINTLAEQIKAKYNSMFACLGLQSGFISQENQEITLQSRVVSSAPSRSPPPWSR